MKKNKIVKNIKKPFFGKNISSNFENASSNHRTVNEYIEDSSAQTSWCDKGKQENNTVSNDQNYANKKYPLSTSKQIFERAAATNILKTTRCRLLKNIVIVTKPNLRLPLNGRHEIKGLQFARQYFKADFQTAIFTEERRATLDGWGIKDCNWFSKTLYAQTATRERKSDVLGKNHWWRVSCSEFRMG